MEVRKHQRKVLLLSSSSTCSCYCYPSWLFWLSTRICRVESTSKVFASTGAGYDDSGDNELNSSGRNARRWIACFPLYRLPWSFSACNRSDVHDIEHRILAHLGLDNPRLLLVTPSIIGVASTYSSASGRHSFFPRHVRLGRCGWQHK